MNLAYFSVTCFSSTLQIIPAALLLVNIVAFAAYGIDKRKALRNRWRIPESTLLLLAFFGGAMGALLGMRVFHHKTKHWKFKILVPLLLVLQLALAMWLLNLFHLDSTLSGCVSL